MVWGWGDTTILWNSHPCPGTVIRGRGGTLESVRDGGGSSASMGVVPKEPLPPAYTALGWPRSQPLLGDARGRPVPRNSRFSVSHLEILNIISFFPFLLQRSPLHRGHKVPAGTWHPKGALPAPSPLLPLARHDALLLGYSRLGFELVPGASHQKQSTDRWNTLHGHDANKQLPVLSPPSHSSSP